MAKEISDDSLSMSAQEVANAFVKQYYLILHLAPEDAHKFYKDTSVMGRPGPDRTMTEVTTMKGINDEIMSIDYKECTSKIDAVHAQSSLDESVIVGVTGHLTGKDNVTKNFTQTFLLAPQASGGYYVMNDFLFYVDVKEAVPSAGLSVDDVAENATNAPSPQDPEPAHVPETKEVSDNSPKLSDQSDSKSLVAKSEARSKPNTSKNNVVPLPKPAASFQADPSKKSYASMLAKESEATTPALVIVRVNPSQQSSASVPKPASPPTRASAPTSNGAPGNNNSPADAKAIHIRGLPCEITDKELIESFKKFGIVKEHSIRIKRFEDGFCYAFLEFETSKSARSAVESEIAVFRGKEAQIQYKKSSNQAGNNRGRSPPARGGYSNDNSMSRDNFGEGRWGGRYESGQAPRGSPTGRNENYRDQARGSSRGRYENYRDQARGSSAGRTGESHQRRGYQNGGERMFRRGGGN